MAPLVSKAGPAGESEESSDPAYGLELGAEVEYDAPVITGISPATGPLNGGTKVTITGAHLRYSSVHLGGVDSGKYEDTDTTAVINVPAGKAEGPVDVVLKTAGGTATLAGGFTYGPKEVHEETQAEREAREREEREEEEEECEEGERTDCGSGGSPGGGSGGGETKPVEAPLKPGPGPSPAPAPSGASSAQTKFKPPQIKVAKADGLSLAPSAPGPGLSTSKESSSSPAPRTRATPGASSSARPLPTPGAPVRPRSSWPRAPPPRHCSPRPHTPSPRHDHLHRRPGRQEHPNRGGGGPRWRPST